MKTRRIIALCACICMVLASCNSRPKPESPATGTATDSGVSGQVSVTMRPRAQQHPGSIVVFYVGEEPVYNAEFRFHLVTAINAYANSDEAREVGFNPDIALSEQHYPDSDLTFEDIFTENVIDELQYSIAMYIEAKAAGFELSQEFRASIDAFFGQFDEYISQAGVTDEEAFEARYGMKMSRGQVYSIMERNMLGQAYGQYISDKTEIQDIIDKYEISYP